MEQIITFTKSLLPTKRSGLKTADNIFDPLGCLSSFRINLKVMFLQYCKDKRGSDEELSSKERHKYAILMTELGNLQNVSIPICYFLEGKKMHNLQIHRFSDACKNS